MSQFVEIPASVTKEQFQKLVPFYGCVNAEPVTVEGKQYAPRTLRYVTFAGSYEMPDKKFHGRQRFEPLAGPDESAAIFGPVAGILQE